MEIKKQRPIESVSLILVTDNEGFVLGGDGGMESVKQM